MENNQITTETELALEAITLQETRQLEQNEEDQNEIFHDSLTEVQLQQQLNESQILENMAEGGNGQNPPTHTDHEKSKHPQPIQSTETHTAPRGTRELQNLGSHNGAGMEETATTQLSRRRRSVSIQALKSDYDFFKRRADDAEEYLPQARTPGDEMEAKQTFADFKHATDGMKTTGQSIIDRLVSDGRIADSNTFKIEINRRLNVVAEFREIYGDVLSVTDTWHPG